MSVLIGEDRDGNRFYNLNNKTYTAENSSRGERAIGVANEEFLINIIPDFNENFNPGAPNIKKHEVQNHKENTEMALIDELKKLITKVENDKAACEQSAQRSEVRFNASNQGGEDMDDKEKVIIVGQVCPTYSTVIELQKITKNPPLN